MLKTYIKKKIFFFKNIKKKINIWDNFYYLKFWKLYKVYIYIYMYQIDFFDLFNEWKKYDYTNLKSEGKKPYHRK